MDTNLNIALVEDNDDLRDLLLRDVAKAGFSVQGVSCADDLDDLAVSTVFDVLILDINLPGESGLVIAQRYKRANPDLYIIMLTARVGTDDKVTGYQAGADIYLTKPISSSELMAALGTVSRRLSKQSLADPDLVLSLKEMILIGSGRVALNRHEVIVLKALSESANGNLPYYRLLELCGEEVTATSKSTLEVRMVRLRKKLAEVGVESRAIKTIRGEGYQLLCQIQVS